VHLPSPSSPFLICFLPFPCKGGPGRRRRKRRRGRSGGWGDNRSSFKLGGGGQLGRGELLAVDEEEDEEEVLAVDGKAGVKEEIVEHVAHGVSGVKGEVDGMVVNEEAVDDMVVVQELDEAAEERAGVKKEIEVESEEVGRVKEELAEGGRSAEEPELDEDAFSDDDLL